ncbi:hypothetical protein EYB25_000282 [Talaromyces marneffei]|nr:hypothetical protein EYB25_000282 [Talaromyces marneffei]
MSSSTLPTYFEYSWAILSSIGIANVLFGFTVISITNLSQISILPVIVSAAGAIANGLCYCAYYADYPKTPTAVASALADIAWLVQEVGLTFYSYLILNRVLQGRHRTIFMSLFWVFIVAAIVLRSFIVATRVKSILDDTQSLQSTIDHLHVGYFSLIALIECLSAFFLLQKFAQARRASQDVASKSGLFSYLLKSTEIRLASLALIGVSRAITYSSQSEAQSATSVASQIDRFVYTLETIFPVMLFIDILASRIAVGQHRYEISSHTRNQGQKSSGLNTRSQRERTEFEMYGNMQTQVYVGDEASSSQEHIVNAASISNNAESAEYGQGGERKHDGISKTVEFKMHEGAA